ncbi:MAG: pyridoxal phosphate-dependent aminotransferase [Thermoanaerobaculales bacterium]|nr:pyridoxal phosphate-dependent aminotransferase [Thermoanaerobaculales bacterium]
MTGFSRRVPRDLGPSRLAAARARLGRPELDLTVTNPTACGLPYPDDLLAPLADPAGLLYRPDPRGPAATRRAVAAFYREWGVAVDPEAVVLTASTSEAYSVLIKLLCDPGDAVLVPTPSYPLLDQLGRLDGIAVLPFALDPDDGWRPDLQALAAAPERTRAVVLVHPNNPTGSHIHPDDAAAVRSLCRERGWALVADEVFLPYPLDGGPGSAMSFAGETDCPSFTLGGLSKSLGLPQLKLAWIVAGGPAAFVSVALDRLDHIADAYLSVSTPVALAAPRLMTAALPVRRAIGERCRANLATLRLAAAGLPAVTVPPVGGGWSALLRLPAVVDDETFALDLLEQRGVAVQPGYLFDLPHEGTLVLSLLTPEEVWRRGIAAILEALRAVL